MTLEEYLCFLGFPGGKSPFASVNARDERGVLEGYFVPPPYFETLWGDPITPQSAIILAPTGGGKTALAVMIDERAMDHDPLQDSRMPVLTVLYDDFTRLGLSQSKQDLDSHFSAVNYLLTLHLISSISKITFPHLRLDSDEKAVMRHCFAKYAAGKAPSEIYKDLEKIKTPFELLQDAAKKVITAVPVISLLVKALELSTEKLTAGADIAKSISSIKEETRTLNATPETDFHRLIALLNKLYAAVYILVDRVDETPWTQRNAESSFNLIKPLISNLNLLDYPGRKFCFKFFLWDAIDEFYKNQARPDRIFSQSLDWKPDQLIQMLNKRLLAFSSNNITDFNQLFHNFSLDDANKPSDILLIFAGTSPRSILTLGRYIIEEQVNEINHGGAAVSKITQSALSTAISRYSREIAHKHIPVERALREISSVNNIVFTTKLLINEVFRGQSPQSVRSKVGKWKKYDVFEVIGSELSGNQGFPTEILAFTNPCVAFISGNIPLESFLKDKTRRCQKCGSIILRDFEKGGKFTCSNCYYSFELTKATTKEHEEKQIAIRKVSRDLSKLFTNEDIKTVCKAANIPFEDATFVGSSYLIWLRIFQFLDENSTDGLCNLLETLEDSTEGSTSTGKDILNQIEILRTRIKC